MPPYLVLARKYRPSTFSDVVGQDHVITTLKNSIRSGRVGHAFLFCGVRGVGKTTVARVLAKSLNCTGRDRDDVDPCNECVSCREIAGGYSVDVMEIDGASNTSVENIREINDNIKYPPVGSQYKIIIIDEVHMISINAFNALLKTLEEPPQHAKFIFATTESHKVPATINSRCQKYNFRTISTLDISSGLKKILDQEGIQADSESLHVIAREAKGSFRDALSLLDQVIAFSDGQVTIGQVSSILGIDGRDCLAKLIGMTVSNDAAGVLALLNESFQRGYDPDQFIIDLIQFIRNLIVVATIDDLNLASSLVDVSPSEMEEMKNLVSMASVQTFQNFFSILLKSESEVKKSQNPWVALEMLMLRMTNASQLVDLRSLIDKIHHLQKTAGTYAAGHSQNRSAQSHVRRNDEQIKPAFSGNPVTESPASDNRLKSDGSAVNSLANGCTPPSAQALTANAVDIWADLKSAIRTQGHEAFLALMEHGELVSHGPKMVEIGFNKKVWKEQFEDSIKNKPELKNIFDDFLGNIKLKTLVLAQETFLEDRRPYEVATDGQTDQHRAIRSEAMENSIIRAVLKEFENSSVEEIKILAPK